MSRRATIVTIASAGVFALILGIVIGFLTTFTHRQYAPWGIIAGLVLVGCFVAGVRLVFESRAVAAAGGLGVVAAAFVLTLPGAGGSLLVIGAAEDPLAWTGWVWAIAPSLLTAALVVAPLPPARRIRRPRAPRIVP